MDKQEFQEGQRVSLKGNPQKKGRLDFFERAEGGINFYSVLWDDGSLQTMAEHEIIEEVQIKHSWDLLANNTLSDYRDFSIATTFHKIRNTTSNTISSLKASRTIFKPYQYKPLVKFLKSDLKRILVADEVGLGKTIEAGHIMLELAARNLLKNCLVICTNSLRDKWKSELEDKFNFILKRYESSRDFLDDVRLDIASGNKSIFGILNYEKCRGLDIADVLEKTGYRFDLVICDEAHKVRNSETAQHKGVSTIVDASDAAVFLTATPIMTDIKNLHSLIRVLDRQSYDTFDIFNNAVNQNKPFIQALSKINAGLSLDQIAAALLDSTVVREMTANDEVFSTSRLTIREIYKDDELFQRVITRMIHGDPSLTSTELRVSIQQDLIELNSLNSLYTRTRKRDVMNEGEIVKRRAHTYPVILSDEEQFVYDSVINEYADPDNLGLMQRKRQMASCIVAFQSKRENLERGIIDCNIRDSKFEVFEEIINEVVINQNKKLIVFAFFTNTLLYLRIRLAELGISSELIYGGVTDRTDRISNFQCDPNVRVLLSSEVGSEGIDLQFCDALVNYDLPWNPMVIEQRIGRIDRVGQTSRAIHIYNLIIKGTIEERIYQRLYQRIELFRESIGDLEEILGEEEPIGELITKGIESLYRNRLTEEEQNAELDRLRLAIEHNKQILQKVRTELAEAFANDFHFKDEIEAIEKNNRYLTKIEIIKYIETIIRRELSEVQFRQLDDNIYEFVMPANGLYSLFDFIEKHKDSGQNNRELDSLYRKFKKHFGQRSIRVTFDQEFAYSNRTVDYISAFHPLINAITNYYAAAQYSQNLAYKVAIKRSLLDRFSISEGFYVLVVFRVTVKRIQGEIKTQMDYLKSLVADINGDDVQVLDAELGEHIYGQTQLYCERFGEDLELTREFVGEIRRPIMMKIKAIESAVRADEEIRFRSSIRRRIRQEMSYYQSRINRVQDMLSSGIGVENFLRKDLSDYERRIKSLEEEGRGARIEVDHTLISTNMLQVI